MQINRTGWFLILFFGLGGLLMVGVAAAFTGFAWDLSGLWGTGAIWFLGAVGMFFYAIRQGRKAAADDVLARNGIKGTATIVAAESGNMLVNEQPVMNLKIRLEAPGLEAREVDSQATIPMTAVAHLQRDGTLTLPAYLDPKDPGRYVIAW
jgi:hypothetical protein